MYIEYYKYERYWNKNKLKLIILEIYNKKFKK